MTLHTLFTESNLAYTYTEHTNISMLFKFGSQRFFYPSSSNNLKTWLYLFCPAQFFLLSGKNLIHNLLNILSADASND